MFANDNTRLDKVRERHLKAMNKGQAILFRIALGDDCSYDSEYDGINDSYCRYCDANLSRSEHDEECDIFGARQALGKLWPNYVNDIEGEKTAIQKQRDDERAQYNHKHEKIECGRCGKMVARMGMKDHQKSQSCKLCAGNKRLREHEERTGIKCITDPYINFEGPHCKHCNKPMPGAHPNKMFCSNKGAGNCKDKHHSRQPHRIEQSRKYAKPRKLTTEETALLITAVWRENAEGWDDHKDCF